MNKILYVDEDKILAGVVESILTTFGYELESINREEALQSVSWDGYKLVIIDWMFDGGALAVLKKIVEQGYKGRLLVTSSRAVSNTERLRLEQEGVMFLAKPFTATALSLGVERALR